MKLQLDSSTLLQFQTDGVTVLRGLFVDWVETLRDGIAANIANPNPDARTYQSKDGGGQFFVDYCSWQRIPQYRDFIFNSLAAEIGANLMDSEKVQLFHEHVLVKEAQTDIATPWHHDMPYYCVTVQRLSVCGSPWMKFLGRGPWNLFRDHINGEKLTVLNVLMANH